MSDHSELKRLAEAATPGPWAYDGSYVCPARTEDGTTYVELWRYIADCHQPENTKFIAAANPAAVLALIAEVEGLRAQHGRDSAELRSLSQARDDARKERDQLKAEVAGLRTGYEAYEQVNSELKAEVEGLDKTLAVTDAAAQKWLEERTAQQSALTEARQFFDSILDDPRLVVAMPSALLVGVKAFLSRKSAPAALGKGEQS